MGRGAADDTGEAGGLGRTRLDRVLGSVAAARPDADDVEDVDDTDPSSPPHLTGRGAEGVAPAARRHAAPGEPSAGRWRLTGAPAGAAVAVAAVAVVVSVLLLDGGDGGEEVLVGPAGGAGPAPAGAVEATGPTVGTTGGGPTVPGAVGPAPVTSPGVAPEATGSSGPPGPPGAPGAPGGPAGPGPLVVHVDGAVTRPGVVTLPAGARVADAVAAAGGVTDEADTRLVNLARPLGDGELVVVPRPGEQAPPVQPAATGGGAAGGGDGPQGAVAAGPLDLNTADAAALDALPGIGPVLAERVVAHRDEVGPFTSVDDLEQVPGIGPAVLADVRDLVRAGPP